MAHDPKQDAFEKLAQRARRSWLENEGNGPWITLSQSWHRSNHSNGGVHCALSDVTRRDKALSKSGWDSSCIEGQPGFSTSYVDGESRATYHRYSMEDGMEPIIIYRQHYGLVPDEYHISEEFILLMQLWRNPDTGNYESLENYTRVEAIQIDDDCIRVRTPILRRYQAAKQMDLLLFVDSVQYIDGFEEAEDFISLNEDDHVISGDTSISLHVSDYGDRVFSRLLATRVLLPPPQEDSGIWPWEMEEEYPEFIIGETSTGKSITSTCNPDELGNYFGANPDSPHYLTPVFFRREVLQRYYDDPVCKVSDGRLTCGNLWGVQIDNHGANLVSVFLGDIGRDIPAAQRDHWKSHNVAPIGGMSDTNFRRSFLNQSVASRNPEHRFKSAYARLQGAWTEKFGSGLFREPRGSDTHALNRLRIPLNETDAEFETQLLLLCKLLVDLLNEKELVRGLDKIKDEKGISKFSRRLAQIGYPEVDRDIAFMRRLQELRSKVSAHSKGSDFERYFKAQLGEGSRPDLIASLMGAAIEMSEGIVAQIQSIDE